MAIRQNFRTLLNFSLGKIDDLQAMDALGIEYGCESRRNIGYDNERGKGDHKHYGEREEAYTFSTPEKLLEDFFADVQTLRKGGKA